MERYHPELLLPGLQDEIAKFLDSVNDRALRDVLIEVLERHFPSDDAHEESAPGS